MLQKPQLEEAAVEERSNRKATGAKAVPKWESTVRERIVSRCRQFQKPLADLANRSANEGDTRLLVTDFLCAALGYDKYTHLTTEYQVKGEFADYGIRVDGEILAFVEVKRVGTKLGARQLRQVEMYAVNEGAEWMILTNGAEWQVYHLEVGLPVTIDLVFSFNLDSTINDKAIAELFYLSLESFRRKQIDDLWRRKRATSPESIADILRSEPVLSVIARELRKASGQRLDNDDISKILNASIIRTDIGS